ncbi:MAG: hypothetical protein H6741_30860 [Alphaproteobacteria bacterium]|nr:hypothetical protein [Alphaproteobacteria bacterium]
MSTTTTHTITGQSGDWEIEVESDQGATTDAAGHVIQRADTIRVKFKPKGGATACKKLVFVQTVKWVAYDAAGQVITKYKRRRDHFKDPNDSPYDHVEDDEVEVGFYRVAVDHLSCEKDPFYNGDDDPHDKGGDQYPDKPRAGISDTPRANLYIYQDDIAKLCKEFETAAICVETGELLGSVKWKSCSVRGHKGQITLNEDPPVEHTPSDALKNALKEFMENHTRKKNGVLYWYCPDDDDGTHDRPVPEGLQEAMDKINQHSLAPGATDLMGTGHYLASLQQGLDRAFAEPGAAALKLTWTGEQVKDVTTVTFAVNVGLDPAALSAFSDAGPLRNDLTAHAGLFNSQTWMRGALTATALLAPMLAQSRGDAVLMVISGLGQDAAAARCALDRRAVSALVRLIAHETDSPSATSRALRYLDLNMGLGGREERLFAPPAPAAPAPEGEPTRPEVRTVRDVEGVDDYFAARLEEAGLRSLEALAAVDAGAVKVERVSAERLRRWRSMAGLLLAHPELEGNDVEVLVRGLGLEDAEAVAGARGTLSPADLEAAFAKAKVPADHDLGRIKGLLGL